MEASEQADKMIEIGRRKAGDERRIVGRGDMPDLHQALNDYAAGRLRVTLPTEPISVRIATAVHFTGISRSQIYDLIEAGDIETKKIGRSTFLLYRSLKRRLEGDSR